MGCRVAACFVVAAASAVPPAQAKEPKLTAEDVVTGHLLALGPAEVRSATRSRIAEGSVALKILVGGTAHLTGRALLYSEPGTQRINLRFDEPNYYGESFTLVGDKSDAGFAQPSRRSPIGSFFATYDDSLREGILTGALSTSWALLDVAARGAKLKYDGIKKVDDKPLHQITYQPKKKKSEMRILLFFDPETFRHVRTTYTLTIPAPMGATITESSQQQDSHYNLEETFDGFQQVEGLTLPTQWTLRFGSEEGTRSSLWKFDTAVQRFRINLATGDVPQN
jgi:hypothetical protein